MLRALRDTKIRTATGADQVRHRAPAHLSASGLWSGSSALRLGVVVGLGWLAAGVLAMVIVGSLVPFSFDLSLVTGRGRPGLSQFGWPITPAEDLVANFVGYLPVGVLVYLLFISATRRAGSSAMAALALAVAMSTALEWLQTMMPSRTASWMDVCTNGLGAAAGIAGAAVVAATGTWVPGLTRALCPRACAAPVTALACGLLLYHLIPFDFVTSTAALQRSLAQSRLWPFIPGSVGTEAGGLAVIGWLGSGGQFAVLGCLCMMCQAARGLNPGSSIRWSVWCVGLVAMATETAQLFVASHAFDTLDWLAAMAGGLVGIALAGCLRHRGRRMSLTVLAGAVLLGEVAYLALASAWPFDLSWRHVDLDRVACLPFAAWPTRPFGVAMGELLSTLISYAVLAALVRVVLERAHSVPRSFVIVAATVGTACLCQMFELLTSSRHPDLTQPAIALLVGVPIALWPIRLQAGPTGSPGCPKA